MKIETNTFDIPILLEFFARFETFEKVFKAVKRVKPRKLFLYQDGPRNEADLVGIKRCRDLINEVDWECEINTYYQDKNVGCDPSGFIAQSWFFSNVEYGIVLEDDCVPNDSFFFFCKEMLLKYKDDESIALISGFNLLDKYQDLKNPGSYFFTAHGGIWGWASWARFYRLCDETYCWLDDATKVKTIKKNFSSRLEGKQYIKLARKRKQEGKAYFETILYAAARLNNMLEIVPSVNLISNIGFGPSGTHSDLKYKKLPPKVRRLFNKKTYELDFPLIHPVHLIRNKKYESKIEPKWYDFIERFFYKIVG